MLVVLKIVPMLLALCSLLNIVFDFFGKDSGVLSALGGVSLFPLLFIYLASYVFGFCTYHRLFLHYIVANNVLTYIDYYIGIPLTNMELFALYLVIVGLLLYSILYYHQKGCCRR